MEPVVERAAVVVVDGHVAALHAERKAVGLARQPQDAVVLMLLLVVLG